MQNYQSVSFMNLVLSQGFLHKVLKRKNNKSCVSSPDKMSFILWAWSVVSHTFKQQYLWS